MKKACYNFCIVTYETLPNPITQNLKTFLLENYDCNLLYIFHPMLDIKEGYRMSSGFHYYQNNRLNNSKKAYHWSLYWPLAYIKDVLYTFYWCFKLKTKFDIYFAAGNLNPLVGITLKRLGIVNKVVYQSLDYYPTRFKNVFFNWLYFQLDRFCVRFSDETWNVNSRIAKARHQKMGMDPKAFNNQHTVPGGVWFYKVKRLPYEKINRNKIIYRGTLKDFMGIDLAIKAMPLILTKLPNLIFEIIGTGEDRIRLENLSKRLHISKNILFRGFVKGRKNLEKALSDAAIGVATFNTNILDDKVKNSDPGKIKDYMLMGLPVITTNAFNYHRNITKNKCGLVIRYNSGEFARAVIRILTNGKLLQEYKENATKFIEKFDCSKIFGPNINRILTIDKHYQYQLSYFNKEFSKNHRYKLLAWNKSYVEKIRNYLFKENFKDKTLLDIGAGSAYVTVEMAKVGLKVIALDSSKTVIDNIKHYKSNFHLKNIKAVESHAQKLPLKDESIDYIVANAILEHIKDETQAINEWKRVLKPGGRMMVTVPLRYKYVWPFLWPVNYIRDKQIGHLRRYGIEDLKSKFNIKIINCFYTGHLLKVFWAISSMMLNSHKFDEKAETLDEKEKYKRYGASNIIVILEK